VAAEAEGITDPADAEWMVASVRRTMLSLSAGHKDHPDYQAERSLRTEEERLPWP
jgi:hypothetical protein